MLDATNIRHEQLFTEYGWMAIHTDVMETFQSLEGNFKVFDVISLGGRTYTGT